MSNKPTLIIDVSHLFYQAIFSMPGLSYEEKETHIIFNFMGRVISLANKFQTNRFVFCFDSSKSKRKEIYPTYKEKRWQKEKTPEEKEMFRLGFSQLRQLEEEVLPNLGFKNIFKQEGFESDDLISYICKKYGKKIDFKIVSSDEDLFQLLDYCDMYNSKTGKIYTRNNFIKEYGIEPSDWWIIKSLAGCSSDCVKGVEGVGEKTAIKYFNSELPDGKKLQSIKSEEGIKIFHRNINLVRLPFKGLQDFKLSLNEKFDMVKFVSMCENFGFRSFLTGKAIEQWQNIFCEGK